MKKTTKKVLKAVGLVYGVYTLLTCCVFGGVGFGFGLGHTPEEDEAELLEAVRNDLTGKDGFMPMVVAAGFTLGDKLRRKGI